MKREILSQMLEDIHGQGETVSAALPGIRDQVDAITTGRAVRKAKRILLVGCGDSLYAGMAARLPLQEWSGIWVEPVESLELRYLAGALSTASLVVGISVSGQVERTLDALELARSHGALTIGITGTPNSDINSIADAVIDIGVRVREPGPVPQTVHFLANLVTLYRFGLSLGSAAEHLSPNRAERLHGSVSSILNQVRGVAERNQGEIKRFVEAHWASKSLVLIGGGPNWATAHFGAAKLLEAALTLGVVQELEEWAHEQFFLTGPNTPTVLIAASGVASDRFRPTADAATGLGAPLALILPEVSDLGHGNAAWTYPDGIPEFLSPILTKVPLELLAYSLASHLDRRPFDYDNPVRRQIVEQTIYRNGRSGAAINHGLPAREEPDG